MKIQNAIFSLLFGRALCFDLQIFHTNDLHSRFDDVNDKTKVCKEKETCFGSFARVAQFVKTHRQKHTLFLNAGDTFQGTPLFVAFGTGIVQPMIDTLGIDAMSLGNHEFDLGPKKLKDYLGNVNIPTVTCNLDGSKDENFADAKITKSVVIPVEGVNVGVIGYLLPAIKEMSRVGNVTFSDEIECIRQEAQELKNKKEVKIVIAVGHSGWPKDLEIAKNVNEVDVVVGGHTDTFLYTGTPLPSIEKSEGLYPTMVNQSSGKQVPAVQAFGYTKYVGVLNLTFDDTTYQLTSACGNPVLITSDMPKNETVTQMLEKFKKSLSEIYSEQVCKTLVDLNGSCKKDECNMGNIYAEAAADFVETNTKDKNPKFLTIGLTNGGNMRTSILKSSLTDNTITYGDLATLLPYPSYFLQVRINGSLLMKYINISFHKRELGGFLQMSRMKVRYYNTSLNHKAFVKTIHNKYRKVHPCREYDVVVSDFLYRGDGYDFSKGKLIQTFEKPALDIVKDWMIVHKPVNVMETKRIMIRFR